ncbi:DEAD/DEAH box helicase family protein [Flavobacterium restrictum]|uniref:DEAD/DEAH box helicase n=1 Tax=Flavobacterium restrictum TaxID=2594428 RepID=A0A553DRP6_9FLAO|nr:DEAD/DEAH box helicase family protein [Flavobacterium restrictum]TRX35425.1 DEAD/DEAH box helicase [Flavobacterium restrictum]
MALKEAKARIKINKLLEEASWRLLDDENGQANVVLENNIKITQSFINDLGEDFDKTKNGFIDFLLLNENGFPLIVLEAKAEDKNPLIGKEQARKYAKSQNCRFVILSNGNLHYFWDLERGNPNIITKFPTPNSVDGYKNFTPNKEKLISENVEKDYIALTQQPFYAQDPDFQNLASRSLYFERTKVRLMRDYQLKAVRSIQSAVSENKDRFLFEMATGTGKTLTSAAVIKLFLKTRNASRVLFLVDRIELEDQAQKAFEDYLRPDYKSVIYKQNRDDWRKAEIVVTTIQSLLFNNKYKRFFSPTDFDLVISDEAHRSIGGNARAVFEYFIGYKLGLTATPRDYLKKFDEAKKNKDPREFERRLLLDTYRTFGCEDGQPTYRYTLLDGVKEGFLINPKVIDARTEITTQLLSDEGYAVVQPDEEGNDEETSFYQRDFEKKFFSERTNAVFCNSFLENAMRDPITGEVGKTIVFAVSQNHAAKIAQLLNEMADKLYPGKYNSDFAVQVTSLIQDAQQMTINFTNNKLGGSGNFNPEYKTSKTRVCVTVGMMTTGYDCPDILNLCMMRPIFSPTDFVQIKGRGTRKHNFSRDIINKELKEDFKDCEKKEYKLFDFFANCEYFEEKFNYDEILKLPARGTQAGQDGGTNTVEISTYETQDPDKILTFNEQIIGLEGMRIDRMFFQKFEDEVKDNPVVQENIRAGNWDLVLNYINNEILNKPSEFYTIEKLRKAANVDRRLSLREIIEKIYGIIPYFKSKDELLEEEFEKFISDYKPQEKDDVIALKYFFKAYVVDNKVRDIIETKKYTELNVNPTFNINDYKAVKKEWRDIIPNYVKDYVSINRFM